MGKQLSVTLGCDPEVFVAPSGKKNIVTAFGMIPGTKYDPHNILDGMVQVDGCALEFGITPAKTAYEWHDRITSVMTQLKGMIPGHTIKIQPVAEFDPKYWDTKVPQEAKELGCEPDWNAWTGDINPRPDTSQYPNLRSAGGHIHIGWCKDKDPFDKNHFEDCRLVAKQMDYYTGIFSYQWDSDERRRLLYGKAGSFRPKPYGVEYRSLSNMWLSHSALIDWIYYQTRKAVNDLSQGNSAEEKYKDLARHIIDENQVDWMGNNKISYHQIAPYPKIKNLTAVKDTRGPLWA